MTDDTDREPFVCTLPIAPRHHIAGAFRPARPPCVFCRQPVGHGDPIACPTHRTKIDAQPMPWDATS
jgi:hypothetical protein